jgi:hypothetical protein
MLDARMLTGNGPGLCGPVFIRDKGLKISLCRVVERMGMPTNSIPRLRTMSLRRVPRPKRRWSQVDDRAKTLLRQTCQSRSRGLA